MRNREKPRIISRGSSFRYFTHTRDFFVVDFSVPNPKSFGPPGSRSVFICTDTIPFIKKQNNFEKA